MFRRLYCFYLRWWQGRLVLQTLWILVSFSSYGWNVFSVPHGEPERQKKGPPPLSSTRGMRTGPGRACAPPQSPNLCSWEGNVYIKTTSRPEKESFIWLYSFCLVSCVRVEDCQVWKYLCGGFWRVGRSGTVMSKLNQASHVQSLDRFLKCFCHTIFYSWPVSSDLWPKRVS